MTRRKPANHARAVQAARKRNRRHAAERKVMTAHGWRWSVGLRLWVPK